MLIPHEPTIVGVRGVMRSGEWLRTQWIARVACDIGAGPWEPKLGAKTRRILLRLEVDGLVERRAVAERRASGVEMLRDEWRLR